MSESLFVLVFIWVSLCFAGNLSKVECGDFEWRNVEKATYGVDDGPSCLWRSVGGSVDKLLKEDGEVWPSVGLRSLWRSVMAMTVRPAGSSWSSKKWSLYPDSKSWSVLERDHRRTVVPMTVRHTCRQGWWREKEKKLHKYGTTEFMTVHRDHDDPSRGPSTQPRFGRFPANRVLV